MEGRSPARGGAAYAETAAIGSVVSTRDLPDGSPFARPAIASNAGPLPNNHQCQPPPGPWPGPKGVPGATSDAGSSGGADESALPGADPESAVGLGRFGTILRNHTSQPTLPSTSSIISKRGGIRASTTQSNASLRYSPHPSGSGSFDDVADKLTLLFSDEGLEHKYSLYFLQHTLSFWRKTVLVSMILNALFLYACVSQSMQDGVEYLRTASMRGDRNGKDLLQDCPPGLWCLECPPSGRICSRYDPTADLVVWTGCEFLPLVVCLFATYRMPPEVLCKWIHALSIICVVGSAASLIYAGFNHPWTSSELCAITYMVKVYCPLSLMRIKFRWTLAFAPTLSLGFGLVSLLHAKDTFNAWFSAACVLSIGVVACFQAHESEGSFRYRFMQKRHYTKQAGKLIDQLKRLRKTYLYQAADFDSPLEKSIAAIRSLICDPAVTQSQINVLENILEMLTNSDNILLPDLEGQVEGGQVKISADQEAWLFSELTQRKHRPRTAARRRSITFSNAPRRSSVTTLRRKASTTLSLIVSTANVLEPLAVVPAPAASAETRADSHKNLCVLGGSGATRKSRDVLEAEKLQILSPRGPVSISDGTATVFTDAVMGLLARVEEWDWPIFDFERETNGRTLSVLAHYLFEKQKFGPRFSIPPEKLARFFVTVENGYRSTLPYHNAVHAADVLHAVSRLASLQSVARFATDLDLLALYFAAIVHDLDHGGVNNTFLVNSSDPKALLYNDRSVLENHHVATAFAILQQDKCNFLSHMNRTDYASFRELVIDLVLATDLTQHFSVVSSFKNKVSVAASYNPESVREDSALCWKMIMKCGDVSNPSKEWSLYLTWTNRVIQEFLNQGDREQELHLKVSPFMDRHSFNLTANQIGFIDFICIPLYENFDIFANIGEPMETLRNNRLAWGDIRIQEETGARPKNSLLTIDTAAKPSANTAKSPASVSSPALHGTRPSARDSGTARRSAQAKTLIMCPSSA